MAAQRSEHVTRLGDALESNYAELGKLRKLHSLLVAVAAGPEYPHSFPEYPEYLDQEDILSLLRQAAQAEVISLAANRPRFLASPLTSNRTAFARLYADALNAYSKSMRLEEALQDCALNAFYSIGVAKVYMAESVPIWLESDEWMDPGKPFCLSLSLHHLVYDTSATDFRYCQFIADRYRVRYEDLLADNRFSRKVRQQIERLGPATTSELFAMEPGGMWSSEDTLEPMVWLADVFIAKTSTVETYAIDENFSIVVEEPLATVKWDGEETGPYHFLNLGPVPGKTTASSPGQNLLRIHNLVNSNYRKLAKQAERLKTINLGVKEDEQIVQAIKQGEDGDYILSEHAEPVRPLRIGGPDQNLFAFTLNALDMFGRMANNLDQRLGLGQSTDTARQEAIVAQGVNRVESYNQERFVKFVREIARELGRLLFKANVTVPTQHQIGKEIVLDVPWKAAVEEASREGEFTDYDIDIDPYSMAYRSPQQKVMELQETFMELMQLAPLTMQMGMMPDINYYLEEKARLLNNACLQNLLMPIPQQEGQGGHERQPQMGGPREYIHRSAGPGSGANQGGNQQLAMMQAAGADNAQ